MENTLHEILGNLTPSELDELAPASFDARAPRGAVKRIEKMALDKAGLKAKKRVRLKLLIIAAAAVVASAATLFTVNASTGGNIVKFFIGGEEVEGSRRDYVDHDGYRHVTFEAVVPLEFTNYALIIDVDNPEEFVRVFTEETDPEFLSKVRQYNDAAKLESESEPEDFGIVLTDSQELIWEFYYTEVNSNGVEMCYGKGGSYSGKFKYQKTPAGKTYSSSTSIKDCDYENNTKTLVISYVFYVGEEYVKESVKEIEGSYRDYVDHDGFRHISFEATLPIDEFNYAVIFDVDAPSYKDAARVLTEESDPEFFEKLREFRAACEKQLLEWKEQRAAGIDKPNIGETPEIKDFGLVVKDNELCLWNLGEISEEGLMCEMGGEFGGEFMLTGTAKGHPSGSEDTEEAPHGTAYDWEKGTKTLRWAIYYYVGKD